MTPDKDELELIDFVKYLVDSGRLDGAALGVAKQTIKQGRASLSPAQRATIDDVVEKFALNTCPICHQQIPWSEMGFAIEKGHCAAHTQPTD